VRERTARMSQGKQVMCETSGPWEYWTQQNWADVLIFLSSPAIARWTWASCPAQTSRLPSLPQWMSREGPSVGLCVIHHEHQLAFPSWSKSVISHIDYSVNRRRMSWGDVGNAASQSRFAGLLGHCNTSSQAVTEQLLLSLLIPKDREGHVSAGTAI